MSFVTQEEVWETMEPVIAGTFAAFAGDSKVTPAGSFPRIPHAEAMLTYGSAKPDLRNPLVITDVSKHFEQSGFGLFERIVCSGGGVRVVSAPGPPGTHRRYFADTNARAA